MIRSNKKIFYKYFDLMRVCQFLNDKEQLSRVSSILSIIKSNFETEILALPEHELKGIGFDDLMINELDEYRATGDIQSVNKSVNRLEKWIQLIILPDFLNIDMISEVFREERIISKRQLIEYFKSQKSIERYGKDDSELNAYFVDNIDGCFFPHQYRKKYSINDMVISKISGNKIWGNFHNHSKYSDGKCTIPELKNLATSCERTYIGISDHTKRVKGVNEVDILVQHQEIEKLNKIDDNVTVLKSLECEILPDGNLDILDEYLKKCDYVIAAVHSDMRMTKPYATKRVIKAIENTHTNILAHPSSRIYHKNVGLYLDMIKIIDACIANNVTIEINGDADRLDLDPKYIEYALVKGAYFTVDSDTHSIEGYRNINNAIRIAEDNHIPSERILNTYKKEELDCFLKKQ